MGNFGRPFYVVVEHQVLAHDEVEARAWAIDAFSDTIVDVVDVTDARLVQAPNAPGVNPKSSEKKERG